MNYDDLLKLARKGLVIYVCLNGVETVTTVKAFSKGRVYIENRALSWDEFNTQYTLVTVG